MKYAFILHGFNGDTTYTFGPSLKDFFENNGYTTLMPNFPIREAASFKKWSNILDDYKNYFNSDTVVVAHSIGNPFFIKYFCDNKLNAKLYVSVAGFCDLFKVPNRDDLTNAFIDFAVNDNHINYCKQHIQYRYSLYSNNDHVIPFDILQSFVAKIDSIPVFIKGVGHMGNKNNITRLPEIEDIVSNYYKS